jgi:two-component system, cell cycle sensor histidine kinase and response regulator CckA
VRHLTDPLFVWLLEAAPDAMVCVDSGGRIVLVNAQAERMFGYRREELAGQLVEILVPDASQARHPARRAEYAGDPRPRPMGTGIELAGRHRDGSTFPAEISLSAIDTDEGILVTAAISDVSERLELLADRERLKTQAEQDMPAGGRLTVHTANADIDGTYAGSRVGLASGQYATLKVSDSGTGMPREVIDRAFEPFFSTKAKGQGSGLGLGLATVYGIITQAHGHVQIASDSGIGTAFTILLPATSQPAGEISPWPRAAEGGSGETVLVVEDEFALREATRRILARQGYQVITAANGRDAVAVATSHPGGIDLLVTDTIMPEMPGKEAADRIRALCPSVKVLFMSGYTEGILSDHGVLETGINLIQKPFTEKSLLAKLREVIALAAD